MLDVLLAVNRAVAEHYMDKNRWMIEPKFTVIFTPMSSPKNLIGSDNPILHLVSDPIHFSDDFILAVHRLTYPLRGQCFLNKTGHDDFVYHLNILRERLELPPIKIFGGWKNEIPNSRY